MMEVEGRMVSSDDIKDELTAELASLVRIAASEYSVDKCLSAETLQTLCNIFEAVFIHGLKKAFFAKKPRDPRYPEPNFWPLLKRTTESLVLEKLAKLSQIRSEIGKCRAWIRTALNENILEHYLIVFCKDVETMSRYYEKNALIRDPERMNLVIGYVKGLSKIVIMIPVNSSLLNNWTPLPLILCGLVCGKPSRLEKLAKFGHRKGTTSETSETEIAENALECLEGSLEDESYYEDSTEYRDDLSSTYSHPSMMDDGVEQQRISRFLDENSIPSNPIREEIVVAVDQFKVKVKRRTHHKLRRSSASSSGTSSSTEKFLSNSKKVSVEQSLEKSEEIVDRNSDKAGIELDYTDCKSNNGNILMDCQNDFSIQNSNTAGIDADQIIHKKGSSDDEIIKLPAGSSGECCKSDDTSTQTMEIEVLKKQNELEFFSLHQTETDFLGESHEASGSEDLFFINYSRGGNSIAGKGWIGSSPALVHSNVSSSVSTESSHNLENELRGVLILEKNQETHIDIGPTNFERHLSENVEDIQKTGIFMDDQIGVNTLPSENSTEICTDHSKDDSEKIIHFLIAISREKGLDNQDFRCASCSKSIGPTFSAFRVCGINGKYYCDGCCDESKCAIPSRIVHNWDFEPRILCRKNMDLLNKYRDEALFRIDAINPSLYGHSAALKCVKVLREKLSLTAMYLLSCRESIAKDFEQRVWPKNYLYNDLHSYSYADLLLVHSGYMAKHLNNLVNYTLKHIHSCVLCAQKGFICEICTSPKIIYPFQTETTHRCPECHSVYHKECIEKKVCTKCIRRERYSQNPNFLSDHLMLDD